MKYFLILVTFTLIFTPTSQAYDLVENFGSKGWLSDNIDFQDRIESFMGNERYCNKSSEQEMNEVINKLERVKISNPSSLKYVENFDAMVEEFTFLETAKRVEDFTLCQTKSFGNLFSEKAILNKLIQVSFAEFQHLESAFRELNTEIEIAKVDYDKNNTMTDTKFDNMSGNGDFINKLKADKKKVWRDLIALRSLLIARIPYGNRAEMRETILDLTKRESTVTLQRFKLSYLNTLALLSAQARESKNFFQSIQVSTENKLHRIDEDLKKTLVQSGQMKNTLNLMNVSAEYEEDIMCRMDARYKKGPKTRQIAEIPFYFAGTYGLGRMAVLASAKTFGGMSSAIALTARAGVIGLDTYEISVLIDEAAEACFRDEYIAHVQNSCTAQSELSITYQEASIAQCATASAIAAAPIALSGGMRLRDAGGVAGLKARASEIVVKLNKRINFFVSKGDARVIHSMLKERNLLGEAKIDINIFNGLSPKQKIYILEDSTDIALSTEQAQKLLSRSSKKEGAKSVLEQDLRFDPPTVRALLRLNGKDKAEINSILKKLEAKGILKNGAKRTTKDLKTFLNDNPNIKKTILKNERRIKALNPVKRLETIDRILSEVPVSMKAGFREALKQLGDTKFLARYIRELQEETAFKMFYSFNRGAEDAVKLGKLDREVMANIVKARVTGQGREIVVVRDELTSIEFNKLIGRGYIIDIAFDGTSHGKYSHLLQQDMIYGTIMKKSNISYDELRGFLGTRAGQRVWDDMFDGFSDSALSPEWFQTNLIVQSFR